MNDPIVEDIKRGVEKIKERQRVSLSASHGYLKSIPKLAQSQESVTDQALELIPVANRLGLYDVADFLKDKFLSR